MPGRLPTTALAARPKGAKIVSAAPGGRPMPSSRTCVHDATVLRPHSDGDRPAAGRVFHRVIEQVDQHLVDAGRIRRDRAGSSSGSRINRCLAPSCSLARVIASRMSATRSVASARAAVGRCGCARHRANRRQFRQAVGRCVEDRQVVLSRVGVERPRSWRRRRSWAVPLSAVTGVFSSCAAIERK